jgi:hypothetical protein
VSDFPLVRYIRPPQRRWAVDQAERQLDALTKVREAERQTMDVLMDEARRENTHRDFLSLEPTAPEVRVYTWKAPFVLFGVWHDEEWATETLQPEGWKKMLHPRGWDNRSRSQDYPGEERTNFIIDEHKRIVNLFEKLLGDTLFCEHGALWSVECALCETEELLIAKGLDPALLKNLTQDFKPRQGSPAANKVLWALDLGVNRAKHYGFMGDGTKMEQIDAAVRHKEKIGGTRVKGAGFGKAIGFGKDSDAPRGEIDLGRADTTPETDHEITFEKHATECSEDEKKLFDVSNELSESGSMNGPPHSSSPALGGPPLTRAEDLLDNTIVVEKEKRNRKPSEQPDKPKFEEVDAGIGAAVSDDERDQDLKDLVPEPDEKEVASD